MSGILAWGDVVVVAMGILLFALIIGLTFLPDPQTRAAHRKAAHLPFAMKDELDGPA